MKSIQELFRAIQGTAMQRIAVANAADADVLTAVVKARHNKIADAILVGDCDKIVRIANENDLDIGGMEVVDCKDTAQCAPIAVSLVAGGRADILMKGLIESAPFMRAVLDKEGLRSEGRIISSIAVFEVPELDRLLFITDPGFIPLPDLDTKKKLIENAVEAMRKLGIAEPKVAVLCAAETVNPKMISTVDAKSLEDMNRQGEIKNCVVAGPISLDLAVSEKSAAHKNYVHPVAGKADLLVVPTLEVGNTLYKSLVYFAHLNTGGIVSGAKAPIIFTSRADSAQTKLNTIAFAAYLAQRA